MKNKYISKYRKLFSFKPKFIHKVILISALVLIAVLITAKISFLSKQEVISEPITTISPTLTPTATPSPTKTLYQTISELKPNTIIGIKKVVGNFADVDIHIKGDGGYHLYAMDNNGQWKIIWEGNGDKYAGECQDLVNKYYIPKEFLDCNWTPTPFYVTTELNRCVIVFPDKKATAKLCLSSVQGDIRIAGEQCDKPLIDYIKCRDEYTKNDCNKACDDIQNETDRSLCISTNYNSGACNIDKACPYPNFDKEKQAYSDLINKYCKDI